MIRNLTGTNASSISAALTASRHLSGSAALGMVLTLVVVADEADHYDALHAASEAAHEHPCRILVLIRRGSRSEARLDAEIRVGGDAGLGETILLRVYGPLVQHAASVVLPLLLPDAPVLTWWPGHAPPVPGEDSIGRLSHRRVTDAAAAPKPLVALVARRDHHTAGDTDLTWTRTTPWRALLAAALDRPSDEVTGGMVAASRANPAAELLATWLSDGLGVPFERMTSRGPGITGVHLHTANGEISITRPDGRLATLRRPGQPDRKVALAATHHHGAAGRGDATAGPRWCLRRHLANGLRRRRTACRTTLGPPSR